MGLKMIGMFLLAVLSALPYSDAITCLDIGQCNYDFQPLNDVQPMGDISTMCSQVAKSVRCMEEAMADCKENSNFSGSTLRQAQEVLDKHKKQVTALCHNQEMASVQSSDPSSSSDGTGDKHFDQQADEPMKVTCDDILNCSGLDIKQFKTKLEENGRATACSLLTPSITCRKLAIKDCKENRHIDEQDLANYSNQLRSMVKLLDNYCVHATEKEDRKSEASPDVSEGLQTDSLKKNQTKRLEDRTQERPAEPKTKPRDLESGYKTVQENPKKDSNNSSSSYAKHQHEHNDAPISCWSSGNLLFIFGFYFISCNFLLLD